MNIGPIMVEMEEILDYFDQVSAGDPFGWDWPTMSALFPEKVERYKELFLQVRASGLEEAIKGTVWAHPQATNQDK